MPGRLILCATPIGNLGDASPRLTEALASADVIYAEDTRRSATLLRHLGVSVPLRSYFAGNEQQRNAELISHFGDDATVALITDAGTPAVSDPGATAVRAARSAGAAISVVPGPSAVTAALAASGLGADRFVFEGFLPKKGSARTDRIAQLASEERTMVLFSPPQRVAADLADLAEAMDPDRAVVVCRELTKLHEEIEHTTLGTAADHWSSRGTKGEFTLVVDGAAPAQPSIEDALDEVRTAIDGGASLSAAVRDVATRLGVGRRTLYEAAIGQIDRGAGG